MSLTVHPRLLQWQQCHQQPQHQQRWQPVVGFNLLQIIFNEIVKD
jgi:hypothetical protein